MSEETAQPQAELAAYQPEIESAPQESAGAAEQETPFLTVRYNKEERPLSREAAAEYAQKGLNYDKVSGRLAEASQKLGDYGALESLAAGYAQRRGLDGSEAVGALKAALEGDAQAVVDAQLSAFVQAHPQIDPRGLPETVLVEWKRGVPLKEAYLSHKTAALEAQLKARQTNARNAAQSMGGALGSGDAAARPISPEAIQRMSKSELERNHSRIWAYLTGEKQ